VTHAHDPDGGLPSSQGRLHGGPGDPHSGRDPRCIVVDGATEAYDSIRWVSQLVDSFLGLDPDGRPDLDGPSMDAWFRHMQQQWIDRAPEQFASIFEEQKFNEQGSFATLLGCELVGPGSDRPHWAAVALGDAVLFQVRDGRLLTQFPPMAAGDFGIDPDGVSTQPAQLVRMRAALRFATGDLAAGDELYFCTDAIAGWLVNWLQQPSSDLWLCLSSIEHPAAFADLVQQELDARRLKNDDLTLLRVSVRSVPADVLVVSSP
jgi:hypothetical protein